MDINVEKYESQIELERSTRDNRKSVTARLKPEDLLVFNQRLNLFGFNTINEMVHDYRRQADR
jgi:hypothetical protein